MPTGKYSHAHKAIRSLNIRISLLQSTCIYQIRLLLLPVFLLLDGIDFYFANKEKKQVLFLDLIFNQEIAKI